MRSRRVLLMYIQRMVYRRPFEYLGNLGIHTVASFLQSKGFAPRVFTGITTDALALYRTESAEKPFLAVGLYCDYDNQSAVASFSALLKSEYDACVIIGGPQAFHLQTDFLKASRCDVLVRGDGEKTLVELLTHFSSGKGTLDNIMGISYLTADEECISTPERPLNPSLDTLPLPDSSLLVRRERYNLAVASARGCPYRCAFCYEGGNTKALRLRTVGNVMEEIRRGLGENPEIKYVWFIDDTFTLSRKRTLEFCEQLSRLREERDFVWFCEGHPGFLARSSDLIPAMREAGLVRMQIGMESGSDEALTLYGKHFTLHEVRKVVETCWKEDLPQLAGNFIIGGVKETPETLVQTRAFAEELIKHYPGLPDLSTTFVIPLPNTAISRCPKDFGLELLDGRSLTSLEDFPVTETPSLNRFDLCEARHVFLKRMLDSMRERFGADKIPYERIRKHFELALRYGLASSWYRLVYTKDPITQGYFSMLITTPARRLEDIPREEQDAWYPCRVFDSDRVIDRIDGQSRIGDIKLSPLELEMLVLCSGKQHFHAIRKRLSGKMRPDRSPSDGVIRKTLESFAARRWVVFYPE